MRARNIKPGFYDNEDLGECSMAARYIFPGLWMMCDRAGRMECRPKRIKAKLLPYDSIEVEPLLKELESNGLIRTYEVDGKRLIWVPGFAKHQRPHVREAESELPPHPDDTFEVITEHNLGDAQAQPEHNLGDGEPALNPESPFLIPDSHKEACVHGQEQQLAPPAKPVPKLDRPSKRSRPHDWQGFVAVWSAYPLKQGQEEAWCEYCRLVDNGTLAPPGIIRDQIVNMATNDSRWLRGIGIKTLAKWLAGKCWNDEPYIEPGGQLPEPDTPRTYTDEEFERMMAGARA